METIKSFTSLEQSKKLSEILPLESADMFYVAGKGEPVFIGNKMVACGNDDYDALGGPDVLCWSLGALLGVMPQINEWNTPYGYENDKLSQFEPKICKIWEHSFVPSYKVTYGNELSTDIYDNPVDACYEMILKLKEKNLL